MAYDPNLNCGGACKNPMNSENNCPDFSDLYQNEESFDLSSYMSSTANLELCPDDLFQNLFPSNSPDLKKETFDQFDDNEIDSWYHCTASEPQSACASACSSAAPSPVPFNYYNTPPVTPQSERQRPSSPHHLQFDGLTTPMSSTRFAALRMEENNYPSLRQIAAEPIQGINVKQEPDIETTIHSAHSNMNVDQQNHSTGLMVDVKKESDANSPVKQVLKRPASSDVEYGSTSKKNKAVVKGSEEYIQKRQRNNVAVRRSRDKAKQKAIETQKKVDELSNENDKLHARVAELTHELTTLKNLLKSLPHIST